MVKKTYETEEIAVHWDSSRCIHTAICLQSLPGVFDVNRRPWIVLEGASTESIAAAVMKCPSGALTFSSSVISETLERPVTMRPVRSGPMVVRGDVQIVDRNGDAIARESRVTLCRCGNSSNQPFCDNSHRTKGFDEPEPLASGDAEAPDEVCPPQPGFTS